MISKTPTESGYSLIELLVASIILTIAIAAVVGVVRKGADLGVSDEHRRRGRVLVDSVFEDIYQYRNYAFFQSRAPASVIIDSRLAPGTILARGTGAGGAIVEETAMATTGNPMAVTYKEVTVKVQWSEPGAIADSIVMTRKISSL